MEKPAPAPPIWEQQPPEEEPVAEAEIETVEEPIADEVITGEAEELIPEHPPVSIEAPIAPPRRHRKSESRLHG